MVQPDTIIRSARKTLSVSIDSLGKITVRAPKTCSDERIFAFLQSKEKWILRHKARTEHNESRLPPSDLDGYVFLLLGRGCTVRLTEQNHIVYDDSASVVYLPRTRAKERLVQWLKENALRIFTTITQRQAKVMAVSYKRIKVGVARSQWGCCTGDNEIRYSFRLLYAPKEVIEYVVVHELSHINHKNHSTAFWRTVEKYMPDYKKYRKWLKDNGILMRIF